MQTVSGNSLVVRLSIIVGARHLSRNTLYWDFPTPQYTEDGVMSKKHLANGISEHTAHLGSKMGCIFY